jgi:ribonucleoside-diphosphate reductase alpha chain
MAKEGSTVGGLMDSIGTLTSISLQYGVPLETLTRKFAYQRFEPSGFTSNPEIRQAASIIDYVFRWMALQFIPAQSQAQPPPLANGKSAQPVLSVAGFQQDAPSCPNCGHVTVRSGACYKCYNCGDSLGCS